MNEPDKLIGKAVLIGVTLFRADGEFIRQIQVHGTVKSAGADTGVIIEDSKTRKEFFLPPAYDHIHEAAPGVYRALGTGEEYVDPDFVTQWAVRLAEGANETDIDWQGAMDWRAGPPPEETNPKLDGSNAPEDAN